MKPDDSSVGCSRDMIGPPKILMGHVILTTPVSGVVVFPRKTYLIFTYGTSVSAWRQLQV